jgi:hypothetical protein
MAIWEYKIITSGKGGFATPQLLEQHLNQLGKEEWEIVEFRAAPDNPLAFNGLARRTITRDWLPKTEETKPAYVPPPIPKEAPAEAPAAPATAPAPAEAPEDNRDERSFADELPVQRPVNAPVRADLGLGDFDEIDEGSEEDLPTLFDALKPHLRKNQRGDQSVGLEFLAKKFELNESDLLGAFVECGLQTPNGPGEKGSVVEYAGAHYWLEADRKGHFWLATREKRFRIVKATPVPAEELPASPAATVAPAPTPLAPLTGEVPAPAPSAPPAGDRPEPPAVPAATGEKPLLGRLPGLMRRNRHGGGLSGSFGFLTKALKLDDTQLLAALGERGLRLPAADEDKPTFVEDNGLLFWLNRNQRGEIWINARKARRDAGETVPAASAPSAAGTSQAAASEPAAPPPAAPPAAPPVAAPETTLAAVRLLLLPKKRGVGVAARVDEVARQLGRPEETLLQALVAAGLNVPEDAKTKPTFGEHGGEIFWMNRNARAELWLNAKEAARRRSRSRKSGDADAD